MNPYEEKASSIMKKHHPELRDWHGGNIVQVDECKDIVKAIHQAYNEGLAKAEKSVREADVLEAICDWENSDAIAYAVRKYLLEVIRKELTQQKEGER